VPLEMVKVTIRRAEEEMLYPDSVVGVVMLDLRDERKVNMRDPSIIAHISAANIIPNGRSVCRPASLWDNFKAGNLKNILCLN